MVMPLAQPIFPPPAGTSWVLQQNVVVYDGSGQAPNTLNIWPDNGGWGDGDTVYTYGANYSHAGAADYELGRWLYASVALYDWGPLGYFGGTATPTGEVMAVEPDSEAGSQYVNIVETSRHYNTSVGAQVAWPEVFVVRYRVPVNCRPNHYPGVWLTKWVGDVWTALPVTSDALAPGPNTAFNAPGLKVHWVQHDTRWDPSLHTLGGLGGLTWPRMWDSEKLFMLDEFHLQLQAPTTGDFTAQAETVWVKPFLTDGTTTGAPTTGSPTAGLTTALTDVTLTDDLTRLTV